MILIISGIKLHGMGNIAKEIIMAENDHDQNLKNIIYQSIFYKKSF